MTETAHATQDACTDAERYLDNIDEVDAELDGVTLKASCADCDREYEFYHAPVGVWDADAEEYDDHVDAAEIDWEWDDGYQGDRTYNIPAAGDEPLELVFDLDFLLDADTGDVLHQY